jgi:hypothetical protein
LEILTFNNSLKRAAAYKKGAEKVSDEIKKTLVAFQKTQSNLLISTGCSMADVTNQKLGNFFESFPIEIFNVIFGVKLLSKSHSF